MVAKGSHFPEIKLKLTKLFLQFALFSFLMVYICPAAHSFAVRFTLAVYPFYVRRTQLLILGVLPFLRVTSFEPFSSIIIYKQQFLQSDRLRTCQLITNQWTVQFHQCKKLNWVQNSEIECKMVKLKMIDSSDKIEPGQTKWLIEMRRTRPETLYLNFNTKTS